MELLMNTKITPWILNKNSTGRCGQTRGHRVFLSTLCSLGSGAVKLGLQVSPHPLVVDEPHELGGRLASVGGAVDLDPVTDLVP